MEIWIPFADSLTAIVLVTLISGYCIGAIPFGLAITQHWLGIDIRQMGSGNIGATNVLRTGNKTAALLTLLLDSGKGALPCFIVLSIAPAPLANDLAMLAGIAAVIGHMHPVWLGFRGGRGVATCLGVLVVMQPALSLIFIGTWMVTAAIMGYSSLASILSTALLPIIAIVLDGNASEIFGLAMLALLVVARHSDNLSRLASGTESTISLLKQKTAPSTAQSADSFDDDPALAESASQVTPQVTQFDHELPLSPSPQSKAWSPQALANEDKLMSEQDDWDDIPPMPADAPLSPQSDTQLAEPDSKHSDNDYPAYTNRADDSLSAEETAMKSSTTADDNARLAVSSVFAAITPTDMAISHTAPPPPEFIPPQIKTPDREDAADVSQTQAAGISDDLSEDNVIDNPENDTFVKSEKSTPEH